MRGAVQMDVSPSDAVPDEPETSEEIDSDHSVSNDPPTASDGTTVKDALLSTQPEQRLESVEAPYDPERGGVTRVYRGVRKMLDVEGLPAVADIGIGLIEWYEAGGPDIGSDEGDDDAGDGEVGGSPDRPGDLDAVLDEVSSE